VAVSEKWHAGAALFLVAGFLCLCCNRLEEERDLLPLLERLTAEHRVINDVLGRAIVSLEVLQSGGPLDENLFTLQDKMRRLCRFMQHHIATENHYVVPRLAA